jgi:hypothetical protein
MVAGVCLPQDETIRAEIDALHEKGDTEGIQALLVERLAEHLGEPFPDLKLVGTDKKKCRLYDLLDSPAVLFFAATDFYNSVDMAERLRTDDWRVPGYAHIITLVITLDVPDLREQLPSLDDAYITEWPLPEYMAHYRVYPALYFVSGAGLLEGFQLGLEGERIFASESNAEDQ